MSLEHFDENTSIKFSGDFVEKEEFLRAKENIDSLLLSAPSESMCRLNISSEGERYKGVLQVCSAERQFHIEEYALTISVLQRLLFKRMYKKLDQWKKERSIDEITGVISLHSFSIEKEKKIRKY